MKPLPAELNTSASLHGLSAFATLRTRHGQPLLTAEHLARLADTCTYLGLPPPETELPVLEDFPWGLLRLTVSEAGTFYSHRPLPPPAVPGGGVSVWLGSFQVHPQLGGHKTGNYLPYLLAGQEARVRGEFEGLLSDHLGHVTDGARSGLLIRHGEHWTVPGGGLPSITRAAWLSELGVPVSVSAISPGMLRGARHVWLCGTGVGVVPVGQISSQGSDTEPGWTQEYEVCWPETQHPALIIPG